MIPEPLGPRLGRCSDCGVVLPLATDQAAGPQVVLSKQLAQIAPMGVLRERYRIVKFLGQGAHGASYLARHQFLNHPCVVKILPFSAASATEAGVQRLKNEARAGFRVSHPNIVRVLDCDVVHDTWYFVMEFVEGVDLGEFLTSRAAIGFQQALQIGLQAAMGLSAIHAAGLIHRDIKPGNLLLSYSGELKVADLGVAGFAEEGKSDPHLAPVGTVDYMPPEMLDPNVAVDFCSDLFSLGATLYHLITGARPHARAADHGGLLAQLIDFQNRAIEWPSDLRADIPDWFKSAILKCLATNPAERFASANEFVTHLRQFIDSDADPLLQVNAVTSPAPRGLAVLPLENASGTDADEWIGFAVAEFVGSRLAQVQDVYVADRDQLIKTVGDPKRLKDPQFFHSAARLVGAGTIIGGEFTRSGADLDMSITVHRVSDRQSVRLNPVKGKLSGFRELQSRLVQLVIAELGLAERGAPPSSDSTRAVVSIEAQEKYVQARRAFLRGDFSAAIASATEAAELDPEFTEPPGLIGICCARLGRYEEAVTWLAKLQKMAEQQGDLLAIVEAQANFGSMHFFKGEYSVAHDFFSRAADTARQLGLVAELARINNNLGFVLVRLGRLPEAKRAFEAAIETFIAYGALLSLIGPYNGMGNVLMELRQFAEAHEYYAKALALAQPAEAADHIKIGVSHMNIGRCAALSGNFVLAKNEFALALNALDGTGFWNGLTRLYEYLADLNLALGNLQEAIRSADKRIELAQLHSNRTMEAAAWLQKADALERGESHRRAAECRTHAQRLNQSGAPQTNVPSA